jgi:hypothetical protein
MKLFDDAKQPTMEQVVLWGELKQVKEAVIDLRKIIVGAVWLLIINSWLIVGYVTWQ